MAGKDIKLKLLYFALIFNISNMTKENEGTEVNRESQSAAEKPKRKGINRIFHVSRLDYYISMVVSIFFFGVAFMRITKSDLSFLNIDINWIDALQLAVLFGIFGMVARVYYRFFEEKYDKGK